MLKHFFSVLFIVQVTLVTTAQESDIFKAYTIPLELKSNANAVIRLTETKIEISSIKSLVHQYRRVITIFNKNGDEDLNAYVSYDKGVNVKKLKATVYNKVGIEIKKFSKSDFKDVAAVSDISLYEESRIKYLEYTPVDYPYTVEFLYETETDNTAWIPFWYPLEGYFISTEKSTIQVIYDESVGINKKEKNFSGFNITNNSNNTVLRYTAENLFALKAEDLSPNLREFLPSLMITPENFYYEGFTGVTGDWESLGQWMYNNLLVGRNDVSTSTKLNILNLVQGINDPIEKAKIVYKFVQDNTRYISVQEGIGGNQPITAIEVDKVKYGDCKGLTNYTSALLHVVGVESYYTRVHASSESQVNVDQDFVSFLGQTNHVILNIPVENEQSVWLECTSQVKPFGFLGDFTDNRNVLVITPNGGKIVQTPKYATNQNSQITTGYYNILRDGSIEAETKIVTKGIQYDNRFYIEKEERRNQDYFYKKYWKNINNIEIQTMNFLNDKDNVVFTETVNFKAKNYTINAGEKVLFVPNALNRLTSIPDNYHDRKLPLSISRGFMDRDEYEIVLPTDYILEFIPKNVTIESKFGKYTIEIEKLTANKLKYKRMFTVSEGLYPKEDYSEYRNFLKEVSKNDSAKIVLIKQ